jgi:hypothetical protein
MTVLPSASTASIPGPQRKHGGESRRRAGEPSRLDRPVVRWMYWPMFMRSIAATQAAQV